MQYRKSKSLTDRNERSKRKCKFEVYGREHRAKGDCHAHYRQALLNEVDGWAVSPYLSMQAQHDMYVTSAQQVIFRMCRNYWVGICSIWGNCTAGAFGLPPPMTNEMGTRVAA